MDGMVDCADPDCAKPSITTVSSVDPSPISCTSTQANGSISITGSKVDVYSINGGANTFDMGDFQNLTAGEFTAWVQNTETRGVETQDVRLNNRFDPLWNVESFDINGPKSICSEMTDVAYTISLEAPFLDLAWSSDSSIISSNYVGSNSSLNFTDVKNGYLIATVQGICGVTVTDSIVITSASPELCVVSNCQTDLFIDNRVLSLAGSPDIYRSLNTLSSNALINMRDQELSAGQELHFFPGFEVGSGINFIATIKPCSK